MASINGSIKYSIGLYQPTRQPTITAKVVPMRKPRIMRNKLAPSASSNEPAVKLVTKEPKISVNGGNRAGLLSGSPVAYEYNSNTDPIDRAPNSRRPENKLRKNCIDQICLTI